MYKNILIPVVFDDDHDTAASIKAAQTMADTGAAFTMMHVMDAIPYFALYQVPSEFLEEARAQSTAELNRLAEALPGATTVLTSGHAGRQIVNQASDLGCDCIIVASHVPGLEDIFIGSTADWVVRHAKCAVHVIR
ncbi:MAG: universal stress protein [Pseudomonadota bacterium]